MIRKLPKAYCLQSESDVRIRTSKVANLYYLEVEGNVMGFFKKIGKRWMLSLNSQIVWFDYLSELFKYAGGML